MLMRRVRVSQERGDEMKRDKGELISIITGTVCVAVMGSFLIAGAPRATPRARPTHSIPTAVTNATGTEEIIIGYPTEWDMIVLDAFWTQYRQPDAIPVVDAQGNPVLDAQGNPTTRAVTAADKEAFLQKQVTAYMFAIVEAYLVEHGETPTGNSVSEKRTSTKTALDQLKQLEKVHVRTRKQRKP